MATVFSVHRLAVIDLHGAHGSALRRRLVLIEFPLSVTLIAPLGGYLINRGGLGGWIGGVWLLGIATSYVPLTVCIAASYVPLTVYAVALARSGRLPAAVRQIDNYPTTARYFSVAQWRLTVPFLLAALALADRMLGP